MRLIACVLALAVIATGAAGCGQAAPAPTTAPAAPSKAAGEPTKAAAPQPTAAPTKAAQPTAAPAKEAAYPQKGRTITALVPFAAGGGMDLGMRFLAPQLESQLGVPVVVANKVGAGGQVGLTELVNSKPDGYTIEIMSMPTMPMTYLDPAYKATYGRNDLQALAGFTAEPFALAVRADSPYKGVKDLVDAARADPGKIVIGVSTLGSALFGMLLLEKAAGVRFSFTNFESSPGTASAVTGGHVPAGVTAITGLTPQVKSGDLRLLGVMDRERYKFIPDVPTMEEQGYKVYVVGDYFIITRAGTPREIVEILNAAIKQATENPDLRSKLEGIGQAVRYRTTAQLDAYWNEQDPQILELTKLVKERQK